MTQIPHGPDHLYCPLPNGLRGRSKMSAVCHTCPLWVKLRGKNPNTGEDVDEWRCSLSWLPMLLVENTDQGRQNGAATESLRNELVRVSENTVAAAETYQALQSRRGPELIDVTPKN